MEFEYGIPPTWERIATGDLQVQIASGPLVLSRYQHASRMRLSDHAHANFSMAYIISGSGQQCSYGREYSLRSGDVMITPAGYVHSSVVGDAGLEVLYVEFLTSHRERFRGLTQTIRYSGKLECCLLKRRLQFLSEHLCMHKKLDDAIYRSTIELLSFVEQKVQIDTESYDWPELIRRRLHDGYQQQFQLASLAEEFGLNPAHVTRRFRERFGLTIGLYLRQLRLSLALGMMIETDKPISLIAIDCGFSDQSHLTRLCKSTIGYSPSAIRKQSQNQAGHFRSQFAT